MMMVPMVMTTMIAINWSVWQESLLLIRVLVRGAMRLYIIAFTLHLIIIIIINIIIIITNIVIIIIIDVVIIIIFIIIIMIKYSLRSKAIWNFSENSSVLVARFVP